MSCRGRTCCAGWVAVGDRDGSPCYVQWLIGPGENALRTFSTLAPGEALLENAYTPVSHRAGFAPYLVHHRVQRWYGLRESATASRSCRPRPPTGADLLTGSTAPRLGGPAA